MCLISYRRCALCNRYAGVVIIDDGIPIPFCADCSRNLNAVRCDMFYVCSVEGCSEPPEFIALVGNGHLGMMFLCTDHFQWSKEDLSTVLVLSRRMDAREPRPVTGGC